MSVNLYRIDCLTNMHVGSGDVNYNIVDNEVEKDPVLGVPTIHSSGIKGALRVYFEERLGKDDPQIKRIFGTLQNTSKEKPETSTPGAYKFFNASLIARPLRVSSGNSAFVNVTSDEVLNTFLSFLKNVGITEVGGTALPEMVKLPGDQASFWASASSCVEVEGLTTQTIDKATSKDLYTALNTLIGNNFSITAHQNFKSFDLPVLARNQLENGISKNLWYEEVVPHQSVFYCVVLTPEQDEPLAFEEMVQIGGNASIGYGFTKITKVV